MTSLKFFLTTRNQQEASQKWSCPRDFGSSDPRDAREDQRNREQSSHGRSQGSVTRSFGVRRDSHWRSASVGILLEGVGAFAPQYSIDLPAKKLWLGEHSGEIRSQHSQAQEERVHDDGRQSHCESLLQEQARWQAASVTINSTGKKFLSYFIAVLTLYFNQFLHPHITTWGSLLRLYGNRSVKSFKEKKQEEQEITVLQNQAAVNQPNYAILNKLKSEMVKLKDLRNDDQSISRFTEVPSLLSSNITI